MPEPGENLRKVASDVPATEDVAREKVEQGENENGDVPGIPGEAPRPREIGGRDGPEPTRYGDWEYKGRCIDF